MKYVVLISLLFATNVFAASDCDLDLATSIRNRVISHANPALKNYLFQIAAKKARNPGDQLVNVINCKSSDLSGYKRVTRSRGFSYNYYYDLISCELQYQSNSSEKYQVLVDTQLFIRDSDCKVMAEDFNLL